MYRRKYMKWHENASINAVVICAESGEESMPSVLLPLQSNKPSLGAWNSERLRWRHNINRHGEKLSFSEGNRSRKLTWKWFLCEWRRFAILPGKIFHLPFLQVLSQQKASFFFIFSMVQLPPHQQCYTNGRMHHEVQDWMNRTPSSWVPWYSMRKLFPFSLGEAIKLLLMLHLSVLGYKTFVCFRCHGSWKIFLGNDTITLKPYLKENICDLARSLSWLHFNLTGGSFPNISVSTGIHTHTHTYLHHFSNQRIWSPGMGWGREAAVGEKGFSCHSGWETSLEQRHIYTKANDVGSEQLPASSLCVNQAQLCHLPASTLDSRPACSQTNKLSPARAQNPKPCSKSSTYRAC